MVVKFVQSRNPCGIRRVPADTGGTIGGTNGTSKTDKRSREMKASSIATSKRTTD
jgi:hypothetical protein